MIEAPEPPHHHGHTGSVWFDRLLGLALLVISAASLWSAHRTGETMESLVDQNARLVRANSTPLLELGSGNLSDSGARELSFSVTNYGTGPARIVWFDLKLGGKPISRASDLLDLAGARRQSANSSSIAPALLKTGEDRIIFLWKVPASEDATNVAAWRRLDVLRQTMGTLTAAACYCSLLGECWTSRLDGAVPTAVPGCDPAGHISYRG